MKLRLKSILALLLAMVLTAPAALAEDSFEADVDKDAREAVHDVEKVAHDESKKLDPKDIIFEHLGDGYGWEVPFDHHHRISLPVIVWVSDGLHVFSSSRVSDGQTYHDGNLDFKIAGHDSPYKGKVVEVLPDGQEIKPKFDFSITKNVCGIFISVVIVLGLMFWLAGFYRRKGLKTPRKGLGFLELLVTFIYDSVIKATLGDKARKFAPYLLSVFFFIFMMNLLGLTVIFPGGANLTGNIAVTLVLAILTFLVTNLFAKKHYWKEIFWPDVPIWLKFPIPIMQFIEVFGIFTKPAALTVRLFANMMGGHMIVLVLTLLIFIFAAVSPAAGGGTTVVSVGFSVFMLLIDVLVSFIQAYVFTMLSTIFISLAQEEEHHDNKAHHNEGAAVAAAK